MNYAAAWQRKVNKNNEGAKMTIQKLASKLAKYEGKKHQATIGDIRELLALLSDLCADPKHAGHVIGALLTSGLKRKGKSK